jgi:thiamine-phosphate pyrophosphorylase
MPAGRQVPPARIEGLYAVLDRTVAGSAAAPEKILEKAARQALSGGCRIVQYRDKISPPALMTACARRILPACREAGALFIVNDRLDVALAVGADGCHLGQDDLPLPDARRIAPPGFLLGQSTHDAREARRAQEQGADYVGTGAVFPTRSKGDALPPRGPALVAEVAAAVRVPVVAISGITVGNVREVIRAGASAFAVISGLFGAPDVEARAREFVGIWEEEKRTR